MASPVRADRVADYVRAIAEEIETEAWDHIPVFDRTTFGQRLEGYERDFSHVDGPKPRRKRIKRGGRIMSQIEFD